jgi:putative sterol carrier protein
MEKLELFSQAWAQAAGQNLQTSTGYQKAAAAWEGTMIFANSSQTHSNAFFDLWHGECRAARLATTTDLENAAYIISADTNTWEQVLTGQLEPIAALLRGKLKLSKGNLAVLVRYVPAAKELVLCAASVPTIFPT